MRQRMVPTVARKVLSRLVRISTAATSRAQLSAFDAACTSNQKSPSVSIPREGGLNWPRNTSATPTGSKKVARTSSHDARDIFHGSPREYARLKQSHGAGRSDFVTMASVPHSVACSGAVESCHNAPNKASSAKLSIPAKNAQVAIDRCLRHAAAVPRPALNIAAARPIAAFRLTIRTGTMCRAVFRRLLRRVHPDNAYFKILSQTRGPAPDTSHREFEVERTLRRRWSVASRQGLLRKISRQVCGKSSPGFVAKRRHLPPVLRFGLSRISHLRRPHKAARSGISDKAKKRGPPRR